MNNLVELAVPVGAVVVFILVVGLTIARLYRRASKEVAFVRTGVGGEKGVMNGGALGLPVFHETMPVNMNTVVLAVVRRDTEALITLDRLRIDGKAEFYVRVRPDAGAIAARPASRPSARPPAVVRPGAKRSRASQHSAEVQAAT